MVQQSTLTLTNIKINRTRVLSVLYTFNCLEQCNCGISARFIHHRSCNKPYLSSYLSVWMSDVLPFVFHIRENECADLNETCYSFDTTWWYFLKLPLRKQNTYENYVPENLFGLGSNLKNMWTNKDNPFHPQTKVVGKR